MHHFRKILRTYVSDTFFPRVKIVWRKKRPVRRVADYHKRKEVARAYIGTRLIELNRHYSFSYKRVAIRNQKSRWGSCSKKGNLNFNYRLIDLPQHLSDYIIVHEICHLKELNHSPRFWALVAETFPNYHALRRELALKGVRYVNS